MPQILRAAEGTATAGTATATVPGINTGTGPSTGGNLFIKGFIITANAPVTAAGIATLSGSASLSPLHFNIGTNFIGQMIVMYEDRSALLVANNTNAVLSVPTLGAAVTVTAQLYCFVE